MGYCWRIYFKVLEVLFLASVSHAFLPSEQACGIHKFRHFCIRQQYLPRTFPYSTGTEKGWSFSPSETTSTVAGPVPGFFAL